MESNSMVPIRLITLNVRYATTHPSPGEQLWPVRSPKLCSQLRFMTSGHTSAFLCLQEVLYSQLVDIQSQLGPSWAHIGEGRDDGHRAGEFSPIFYRTDTWRCERNQTYWLSKTPEKPSRGWDAALNRVVTMGRFCQLATGARVVVMSTHFDHRGETARRESAKLLLELSSRWQQQEEEEERGEGKQSLPLFLGGDFNSTPDGGAYRTITTSPGAMTDIATLVPKDRRYGNPDITYTSFGEPEETPSRLDFLFSKGTDGLGFPTFGILPNRFDDGVFLSDHRAVVADVDIPVPGAASGH